MTKLILNPPLLISPRLIPGVRVGDTWVSVEPHGVVGNRLVWQWHIDANGTEYGGTDLSTGPQHTDNEDGYRQALASLLVFLSAAAEAYRYGTEDDDPIFPTPLAAWADQNDDEINTLIVEIEEPDGE